MHVTIKAFPWRRIQFIIGERPTKVARAEIRYQVNYAAISYCCFESVRMPNQPVRHKAAITTASDTHPLLVDIALLQQGIHTTHDIQCIFLAPGTSHSQRKLSSITDTASR